VEEPTKKSKEEVPKECYQAFANLRSELSNEPLTERPATHRATGHVYFTMPPIDPFNPGDTRIDSGTPIERLAEYQKEEFLRRRAMGKSPHPSIAKLTELSSDHPYRVAWALAERQIALIPKEAPRPQALPTLVVLVGIVLAGFILYLMLR
jgi:hypothetical protein